MKLTAAGAALLVLGTAFLTGNAAAKTQAAQEQATQSFTGETGILLNKRPEPKRTAQEASFTAPGKFRASGAAGNAAIVPDGATAGVAWQLPGYPADGYNLDSFLPPASTQKVITALVAASVLGGDYRYKTELWLDERRISGNTLNGDIIIRFSGAPDLTIDTYRGLLRSIKSRWGVSRVRGSVILDTSAFSGYERASGWIWDDLPICFTAPSSSIVLNHNCFNTVLADNGSGIAAVPEKAKLPGVKVESHALVLTSKQKAEGNCLLEVIPSFDNKYVMYGCVAKNSANKAGEWPMSFAVLDPEKYGTEITASILESLGISSEAVYYSTHPSYEKTAFAGAVESLPVSALIRHMLLVSDNLYADILAKTAARFTKRGPTSYYNTTSFIKSFLRKKVGIELTGMRLMDGNGLSSYNLITPRQMLKILTYIRDHDSELHIVNSLPRSAYTGTLRGRGSVVQGVLKGNVRAKTGTIANVSNLAGFVVDQNGELVPFVIYNNGLTYAKNNGSDGWRGRIMKQRNDFEKSILEDLYYGRRPSVRQKN